MGAKTWKDHLLSSGLPLERSVIQVLKSLGIESYREFSYERANEQGVPTTFSVDIQARWDGFTGTEYELYIECKYRHDGIKWVFTPDEYSDIGGGGFHRTFVILDDLSSTYVNKRHINAHSRAYELCGKGIELLENDTNPKSIEQAIHQLKYALVEEIPGYMIELEPFERLFFVLVPIVVTTAELWRLREDITVENIREAKALDEVATHVHELVLKQQPDNQLMRHTQRLLIERMPQRITEKYNWSDGGRFQDYKSLSLSSLALTLHSFL